MLTPAAGRKAVAYLMSLNRMGERRSGKSIGFCLMTMRYRTTRVDDGAMRQRIKAIARDCEAGYIQAAREGRPEATLVAHRWRLMEYG